MSQTKIKISPQALKALLATASAKAVLIMADNTIAYRVGTPSERGFQTLQTAMKRYWPITPQHDINRYVGLLINKQFYFLYARYLPGGDHLLGLIFPLQTPLIRIRQDMTDIMRAILPYVTPKSLAEDPLEQTLQLLLKTYPEPDPQHPTRVSYTGWRLEVDEESKHIEDESVQQELNIQSSNLSNNEMLQNTGSHSYGLPKQRNVMDDIPWQPIGDDWPLVPEKSQDKWVPSELSARIESSPEKKEVSSKRKDATWQPLNEHPNPEDDLVSILQEDFDLKDDLAGLAEWMLPEDSAPEPEPELKTTGIGAEVEPPISLVDDEQVSRFDADALGGKVSDMTFYLIPSQETDRLAAELSQKLPAKLSDICRVYGWELEDVDLRPGYLKWTLGDFPESLIPVMLNIVRRETSRRIFRDLPEFQTKVPSKNFWSPQYLVDTHNRDFSSQELLSLISKGR